MKRNQVVLFYGMPASGKYTIAKKIQEKCGGVLLDNHYFYDLFDNITEVPNDQKQWYEFSGRVIRVRDAFLNVLRKYYPQKTPVRYIFTSVILSGETFPARLQKFARDIHADFIPIELTVRSDVLLARCNTEMRRQRKKISNPEKYGKLLEQWMPKAFHSRSPNRLVLDSSELTTDATFNQIKKHLKQFD